ncbi:hypothetical protein [Chelativorans alearense]|nr:hypothetical protein [Chelativorans alearense]
MKLFNEFHRWQDGEEIKPIEQRLRRKGGVRIIYAKGAGWAKTAACGS